MTIKTTEYLTEDELRIEEEREKVNRLKCLVLGRGDDGPLAAISKLFGNILESVAGRNERVVSVDDFVTYLVQAGLTTNPDKARQEVLPIMENRRMCYKVTPDLSHSIHISKVRTSEGREGYRVSRYIG